MLSARIKRVAYRVMGFDIESRNSEKDIAKKETSMWLGVLMDADSKREDDVYFLTMEDVLDRMELLSREGWTKDAEGKRRRTLSNLLIYIYNLSFEWSFMLPVMLQKRGFSFSDSPIETPYYSSTSTKTCSSVWEVRMGFGKGHGAIILRDMAKIFPGGLGNVAKSMKLETQKGSIAYMKHRGRRYKPTQKEKDYCYDDVKILLEVAEKVVKDPLLVKSISASTYAISTMIRNGFPKSYNPMKSFRELYPEETGDEMEFLRKTVGGGITYATPAFQFKDIHAKIGHLDLHQAHPSSSYLKYFPYGEGTYWKKTPPVGRFGYSAMHIRISYSGVRLHSVISLIGIEFCDGLDLWVWEFEIPVMEKCYKNFEYEVIDGWFYKMKRLPWREQYHINYNLRLKAKAEGDGYNVARYKLLNNSSYGKLLEHGHNSILENIIDDNGLIDSIEREKPKEEWRDNAKYTCLKVGSAIPAWTRCTLIEGALKIGWEKVVYFDTDSIFYISDPETERIIEEEFNLRDELGGWGREPFIVKGQFTAPKRYKIIEIDDEGNEKTVVHTAGFNFKKGVPLYEALNLENAKMEVDGTCRCKGGTLIIPKMKELSVQKKYESIYNRNKGEIVYEKHIQDED